MAPHPARSLPFAPVPLAAAPAVRSFPVGPAALVPPGAVRAGSVVVCEGPAAVSLALTVVAGPSADGAWVAVLGFPVLGLAAAAEAGVALERMVAVDRRDGGSWADVLAAAIDGFDVVLVGPGVRGITPTVARRVVARATARGAFLVTIDTAPFGADLHLGTVADEWTGPERGTVARARRVVAELAGRRVPRGRRAEVWLAGRPPVARIG